MLEEEQPRKVRCLRDLANSFANFVIVDEYEIMLELIKGQLKYIKKLQLD